jgi:putative addiction module killer protein
MDVSSNAPKECRNIFIYDTGDVIREARFDNHALIFYNWVEIGDYFPTLRGPGLVCQIRESVLDGRHDRELQFTYDRGPPNRRLSTWLQKLKDRRAQERIAQRLVRVEAGLVGDAKFFDGIGELRIDVGPGYRFYFVQRGKVLIILLCGGDKDSQSKDIARAKELVKEISHGDRNNHF